MHFNIYLDDETGRQLKVLAENRGQTRNALIRQALKEWAEVHTDRVEWPEKVITFQGLSEMDAFENHRAALGDTTADPFA